MPIIKILINSLIAQRTSSSSSLNILSYTFSSFSHHFSTCISISPLNSASFQILALCSISCRIFSAFYLYHRHCLCTWPVRLGSWPKTKNISLPPTPCRDRPHHISTSFQLVFHKPFSTFPLITCPSTDSTCAGRFSAFRLFFLRSSILIHAWLLPDAGPVVIVPSTMKDLLLDVLLQGNMADLRLSCNA